MNQDKNEKNNLLRYTLRINRELFGKFKFVASYEGRSVNKEIEMNIKDSIKKFEEKNGEIIL